MINSLLREREQLGGGGGVFCYQKDCSIARSRTSRSDDYEIPGTFLTFLFSIFQWMAATQTGVDGPSVTSHAVVVIDDGHVPVLILCLSMVGWIVRTWETLYSLMCVTPGLVHVSVQRGSIAVYSAPNCLEVSFDSKTGACLLRVFLLKSDLMRDTSRFSTIYRPKIKWLGLA